MQYSREIGLLVIQCLLNPPLGPDAESGIGKSDGYQQQQHWAIAHQVCLKFSTSRPQWWVISARNAGISPAFAPKAEKARSTFKF
jgi:hypothetical protein